MKASMRARRMARNHRRMKKAATLTLVPIIDIFTMLLFFLMVNTGNVEILDPDKTIQLPESFSERRPEPTLLIKVNGTDILIDGKKVAEVAAVAQSDSGQIPELAQALEAFSATQPALTDEQKEHGRLVTIMGDKEIPYHLLKRVMVTCAQSDFRAISLAVATVEQDPNAAPATGEGGA